MKIPVRNVYYLLCYAWQRHEEADLVPAEALDRLDQVHDLFGKVLSEGVFRLVRRGIDRGYHEVTHEIAGLRGKLELAAMATRATKVRGRTVCTYEEYSQNVLHNQILRSTLGLLLGLEDLDRSIRRDVGLAWTKLTGVSTIPLSRNAFRRVQLDRNLREYQFLLQVCELIHESLLVDTRIGEARFTDPRSDERLMWRVFEDFVREFYRREQTRFRVLPERQIRWESLSGRTDDDVRLVPRMLADVLLESADRRIVLDTKFYESPLNFYYGTEKLRPENLYQLLTYLENRQANYPEGPRHEGMLLYAAVERTLNVELEMNGFRVSVRTVDLSRPFREIREELLGTLG